MTIKQQLIPLRIGQGLLSLVALFVMLLAPQRAWAQDNYGLTVAGVPVTSTNANNITGGGISGGTVSYDGTNTLTLNGVTINGSIVVSSDFGDLVVKLVGNSVIQGTEQTSLTSGISTEGGSNGGKLTFEIDENTSGSLFFPYVTTPIKGFDNIEYRNGLEWGCRDEGTTTDYVEGVGTEVVLASIGASLYVTKTKTTMTLSNNGGTVTYRKDDTLGHVLTLSGLTDLTNFISWYSPDGVTIEISGTNSMSFYSSGGSNAVCFDGKPQSSISFIFTGATATLKMYDRSQFKSLDHPWINGFSNASNPTLSDGLKMVEIDEYRYDNNQSLETYVERYITTETYGLNVKGTQVHHLDGVLVGHKDNILGLVYNEQSEKWELSTSVTFNSDDNILTLNNANINYDDGNAIVSSITSPLTVHLTGENSISSGHYLPFVGATGDNANLVFTTNATGTPGSLTMTSTHADFGPTQFFDGFKQILYPEEQGSLSAKSVDGNVVISAEQETGYGLKVAGIVVTEDNASHILGENNTTVTFTPATEATGTEPAKPATLTLNNATISGIIETSIDLTVDFKGSSTIILPTDKEYPFVGNNSPVLSFTNSGKNSNPLTVNGEFNGGNTKFMNGFAQESVDVDINEDRDNATVWWLESTVSAYMYLRWIEKYDLWIGETQFTNLDLELSGGKASFDGDHTLTLNNATLGHAGTEDPEDEPEYMGISSSLPNLTIHIKGDNSIYGGIMGDSHMSTCTLTFTGDDGATLDIAGGDAPIGEFSEVTTNGTYLKSDEPLNWYNNGYWGVSSMTVTTKEVCYPIWVYNNNGYVQVTGTNKDNVLGEQTDTKSVTYNDGTLTLNGATINSGDNYAFVMGDNINALNVVLVGVNTVTGNGFQFTTNSPSLTFKTNGTATGSLAIVDAQNTNYSLATTTVAGGSVTPTYENGLAYTAEAKTVGLPSLGLTIGNTVVTSANKDDVFDGDENLDGKVSFNPQNNTLTLNDANLQTSSLVSTLSNLKVKFNNGCHLKEIVSNNSDATLSFELADNSEDGSYICFYSANAWTGFSADPTLSQNLAYMPNDDTKFIRKVFAPIIALEDGKLMFKDYYGNLIYSGDFSAFACHYSIDYVDNTLEDATGVYTSDSEIQLAHPCTVTAYLTYTDGLSRAVQSANSVGKLFGFEESEIDGVIGTKVDLPAIIPTIAETDGVTISCEGNVSDNNTKVDLTSQTSVGNTTVIASLTGSNQTSYTLLNSNFSLTVNIVPPAPTISPTATLEGDEITITAAEGLDGAQIYYSWDSDDEEGLPYEDNPPTAQSGTLYAWVTMTIEVGDNKYETYTSSKAEQIFSVKKNIANLTVNPNSILDSESVVYTGTTITPTFTLLTNPEDESTAISSSNYDVRIEKFVDETTGYSVVQSIVDAGKYKVYAVGKGDTYGGEKLVYEALKVTKANITGLPTDANYSLNYNGTAQNLITVTVPEGATVMYYSQAITKDDYEDGSFELMCELNEVQYTTTVPTGTNAGYFALLYKVDGGNNYNDIPASGTIKVEIAPAEITEVTLADNSLEYSGKAQEPTIASVKAGNLVLTNNDYEVSYVIVVDQEDNPVDMPSEVGTYKAVVTGKGNFTGTQSAKFTVLKDPKFCFYFGETISNGDTEPCVYGEEQTVPALKRWDNGNLKDPTGFNVTCTSSDANVATIDNTGKITIVGVGLTEIRASIEATEEYAADEAWFTLKVVPAVPQVSIEDGAYFTGQKLSITTDAQGGDLYYSFGYKEDESKRTLYEGEISLPAGEYLFYPYTRCGTVDNPIWSFNWPIELYVYDEPTISKNAGEYEGDIEVEITNLPHSDNVSVTAYYYLGDDEENAKLYTAGDKITVRESTKLNVYLLVEGDSSKYKTKVIERQYTIKDIPLDVTATDFHNHWMTYYHNKNGNVGLPENQNIGAYVATSISGNEIVVTQIKSIPRGEPVLLNNATTTTTTNVFEQGVQDNLLKHATEDVQLDEECDYYGLYNGAFERVKTIPAGKNYLMVSNAVVPGGYAPKLTIVFDNEATGVNDVRSKMDDVRGDIYDLQGRKVQKPSKKGLYINKGHKVVVK